MHGAQCSVRLNKFLLALQSQKETVPDSQLVPRNDGRVWLYLRPVTFWPEQRGAMRGELTWTDGEMT